MTVSESLNEILKKLNEVHDIAEALDALGNVPRSEALLTCVEEAQVVADYAKRDLEGTW